MQGKKAVFIILGVRNFGGWWRWMVSFTLQPLDPPPREWTCRYTLNRRLGEPQRFCACLRRKTSLAPPTIWTTDLTGNSLSYRLRCQVFGIVKVRAMSEELGTDGGDNVWCVRVLYFRNWYVIWWNIKKAGELLGVCNRNVSRVYL
jgi:hypothetical protein